MKRATLTALACFCLTAALIATPQQAFAQEEEDREFTGVEIYKLFCVLCHGTRGGGSPLGPSLLRAEVRALSDDGLYGRISDGQPDKGMSAFKGALSVREISETVDYIRKMQGRTPRPKKAAANPAAAVPSVSLAQLKKGEQLFTGKAGCFYCHSYYNAGGVTGPALDQLNVRLTLDQIREACATPSKSIIQDYKGKKVVTKDGRTIVGLFRNETKEIVQILNREGNLWTTYFKKDLEFFITLKESLMPEDIFTRLTPDEQEAMMAFLGSLK